MNMIKSFALMLFASSLFGTSALAADMTISPNEQKQQLRSEVLSHIQDVNLGHLDAEVEARVSFMVTEKSEIVVLYVESEHDRLASVLKDRLNYKIVETELSKKNQTYFIDLKFQQAQ